MCAFDYFNHLSRAGADALHALCLVHSRQSSLQSAILSVAWSKCVLLSGFPVSQNLLLSYAVSARPRIVHVDGVEHRLGLISTCGMIFDPLLNTLSRITIGFHPTLGEGAPFSRFDVYAPHVRSLDVYGSRKNTFKVSGWLQLIIRAQQKLLLPNLRTLIMEIPMTIWNKSHSLDLLIESYNPPRISYYAASAVLITLAQDQIDLQELCLFPDAKLDPREEGEHTFLAPISREPFYHHLLGTKNLRHLSGTMAWLQHKPRLVLSKLPLLESIAIYSDYDAPAGDTHYISRTRSRDLRVAFWDSQNFIITDMDDGDPLTAITPPVLDILSTLPLQSVTLGRMDCPLIPWPNNFEIAWPLVTKLSMPHQELSLDLLHHFAALPKLEYLEPELNVEWISTPTIPKPGPHAPLHTLVSTYKDAEERDFLDVDKIVRWLLSHWPKLSHMICSECDEWGMLVDTPDHEYFDLLNRRFAELRAPEYTTD
ncbi:hypothetical protein BDV93DRAFT_511215 [Ceratobasidium sp. AG-I]|nr:hypothetical protein BDV93DRAFT_511215 [Ceratobasidium sp. AG-I]